ncbi:MAG: division plane positioning ATPase MipZ [Gaiellaceae bacterium]
MESRPDGVSTVRHYLQALWRRKWIGLVPLVVIPLVVLAASLAQEDLYEASADVLVNRQEVATTSLIGQTPALDDADRTMSTQAMLARVPTVAERTLAAAGATSTSARAFLAQSSVFPLSDFLRFTVSDQDAARATRLASAYAREFVRFRRELDTAGLARTLEELRGQIAQLEAAGNVDSPLYVRLADREQQLESLVALRTSNVSVVRTAGPDDVEQVAPRPRRNVALAAGAGLVVALILVFLAESLSTRPRTDDEFEELLGAPLLARLESEGRGRTALLFGDGAEADSVHKLRINLELAGGAVGRRTIMVTSPRSDEGKSAAVARLGVALARTGRHVTLVDLDLRQGSLTALAGVDNRCGMSALARGECELADALVAIPLDDSSERGAPAASNGRVGSAPLLEVVGSGLAALHAAELVSSRAVASVLAELRERADVVLVDAPPLLEVPDPAAVAAHVDGVLLIVSSRDAHGPTLADTRRVLESWRVATLGFALTGGGTARPHPLQFRRGKPPARTPAGERERVA